MPFGKKIITPAQSLAPLPTGFSARLLLTDGSEHHCEVTAVDPMSALFLTGEALITGSSVTAFIDEVGRVDGTVEEPAEGGYWVSFTHSELSRSRLTRHLRWLMRRENEDTGTRRHTRFEPRNPAATLTLPGGRGQPCQIIDVSLSGAAVRSRLKPAVGTPLLLAGIQCRVVRHVRDGFGIEFLTPLSPADLHNMLR